MGFFSDITKTFRAEKVKAPESQKPKESGISVDMGEKISGASGKVAPALTDVQLMNNQEGWHAIAVNKLAESVSTYFLPKLVDIKTGKEKESHPVLDLIDRANSEMTKDDLIKITQGHKSLVGESFWLLAKSERGKLPVEIHPIYPNTVEIVKKAVGYGIEGFLVKTSTGKQIPFARDDIIFHKDTSFSPLQIYRGRGVSQIIKKSIMLEQKTRDFANNYYHNSAIPSMIVNVQRQLQKDGLQKLRSQFEQNYGGTNNAFKVWLLEGGMTTIPVSPTLKDLQFLESMGLTRDEILGMYGLPKTIMGITDDVNRANAIATEKAYLKWNIMPKINAIHNTLNEFLLPLYKDLAGFKLMNNEIELEEPEERNSRVQFAYSLGIMTKNEAREELNLDPVPDGDSFIDASSEEETPPAEDSGKAFNAIKEMLYDGFEVVKSVIVEETAKLAVDETVKRREIVWKRFDKRVGKYEKKFGNVLNAFFKAQKERAKKKDGKLNIGEENKALTREFLPVYRWILSEEEKAVLKENKKEVRAKSEDEIKFLNARLAILHKINKTTQDKIDAALEDIEENGDSAMEVDDALDELFEGFEDGRTGTISASESVSTANASRLFTFALLGESQKVWVAQRDGTTRPAHVACDGQEKELDEPFFVGGEFLEHPGDPGGSPDNVINCRCTVDTV